MPLFPHRSPIARYVTLDEALALGLRVTEVDAAGTVPELRVVNASGERALLYDGEELIGAKQNRILNVSVLVLDAPDAVDATLGRFVDAAFACQVRLGPAVGLGADLRPAGAALVGSGLELEGELIQLSWRPTRTRRREWRAGLAQERLKLHTPPYPSLVAKVWFSAGCHQG